MGSIQMSAVHTTQIEIQFSGGVGKLIVFDCHWESDVIKSTNDFWKSVDVSLNILLKSGRVDRDDSAFKITVAKPSESSREFSAKQIASKAGLGFIAACAKAALSAPDATASSQGLWKLVSPQQKGYILRSDVLTTRMLDCDIVELVNDFAEPCQYFAADSTKQQDEESLFEVFGSCIGGIFVRQQPGHSFSKISEALDAELDKRLSFPWTTKELSPRKTIVLFEGRVVPRDGDMIYAAAKALNISVIVIDHPGHWTEDPKHSDIREAFLPINIMPDDGLASRLVEAIRGYGKRVDGIWTVADVFTEHVAKAAKMLGLPYNSPEGFNVCSDKFKMRLFQDMPAHRTSCKEPDLSVVLNDSRFRYPLIVKPCLGWNSEGVSKVYNEKDLRMAMTKFKTHHHGFDVVIENYCDGPEVDANFVLDDGRVAWFEAHDDFPKTADTETGTMQSFLETGNVIPSSLPESELSMMRDSLHGIMDRLGLKNGVYHLEARVQDSDMYYDFEDGIMDLRKRPTPLAARPEAFLVELNPRPPGAATMVPIAYAYGIDYAAIGILLAMGDNERARALLNPYIGGSQGWYEIIAVPATQGGVFDSISDDVVPEMLKRRPDLAAHMVHWRFWYEKGDIVPDPSSGTYAWIAVILVRSRTSRLECRKIAEEVRVDLQFTIRPE